MPKKKHTLTNLRDTTIPEYLATLTKEEREELEGYITSHYELWKQFKGKDKSGIGAEFEPLAFFRLLSSERDFVFAHKDRPLSVLERFRTLKLDQWQANHLVDSLINEFVGLQHDRSLVVCLNELAAEVDYMFTVKKSEEGGLIVYAPRSESLMWPTPENDGEFFDDFLAELKFLPTNQRRLERLIEEKAKHRQRNSHIGSDYEDQYLRLLNIEIEKVRELIELERQGGEGDSTGEPQAQDLPDQDEGEGKPRHRRTKARMILLTLALVKKLKGLDKGKVAKLLEYLTGFAHDGLKNEFSNVDIYSERVTRKMDRNRKSFEEDIEAVCYYLDLCGLTDEAVRLRDLTDDETKTQR